MVSLAIFGEGTIRSVYDDGNYCEVEFSNGGTRSLKAERLKKL